ncbi:hypothetical protein WS48_32630 [Burkholderia sp. RF7-non_BP1]|nr:hypothetical protein WS45_17515 [Burkholderia sp. RF2-non_BP3]KUY70951.1 hypothetical protein WS46_31125 [Burkholderia sp. RF4-BP95]KUZ03839.1 hypothetical protein WS48_32630 [Burkholderia sp. RF7-non_BP1]KUZ05042.1 hypothetical protein WS49_07085 [Burkholderia sp. RF7-non_BP4]
MYFVRETAQVLGFWLGRANDAPAQAQSISCLLHWRAVRLRQKGEGHDSRADVQMLVRWLSLSIDMDGSPILDFCCSILRRSFKRLLTFECCSVMAQMLVRILLESSLSLLIFPSNLFLIMTALVLSKYFLVLLTRFR